VAPGFPLIEIQDRIEPLQTAKTFRQGLDHPRHDSQLDRGRLIVEQVALEVLVADPRLPPADDRLPRLAGVDVTIAEGPTRRSVINEWKPAAASPMGILLVCLISRLHRELCRENGPVPRIVPGRGIDEVAGLTVPGRLPTSPTRQRGLPPVLAAEWETLAGASGWYADEGRSQRSTR
jgi:hypothetical protein